MNQVNLHRIRNLFHILKHIGTHSLLSILLYLHEEVVLLTAVMCSK